MQLPPSEELEMLRRSVAEFVDREIRPNVRQWEQDGEVPRDLFCKLAELGYLGVRLSPEYGGGGQDFLVYRVLLQELMQLRFYRCPGGRVMAHAEFATMLIQKGGSAELKEKYVRAACEGRMLGALGVSEPDAGSDVAALRTTAVRDGDDYIINGSKLYITNGTIADYITTAVRTGWPGAPGNIGHCHTWR